MKFEDNKRELIAVSVDNVDALIKPVIEYLPSYRFDHYLFYPSQIKNGWMDYFRSRLKKSLLQDENITFYSQVDNVPFLIGFRISEWDEEIFGHKMCMAAFDFLPEIANSQRIVENLFRSALAILAEKGVEFVSVRINGDNLPAIHGIQENGFKYYENIIWPVAAVEDISPDNRRIPTRLMKEPDLQEVTRIAETYQYQRGHYHCDPKLDNRKVNSLYAKWVNTSWRNNDNIAIIEFKEKVAGYFVFKMDSELSEALGTTYGRLCSLALDSTFRGHGLGINLFNGTLNLIEKMGGQYIDSGYASRNHLSSKLHVINKFYSLYEEITFHLWL